MEDIYAGLIVRSSKNKLEFMLALKLDLVFRCAPVVPSLPLQHSPTVPTHPDFSKLAIAQFLNQLEGFTWNLPHILGLH